jgi:hypothetical protein
MNLKRAAAPVVPLTLAFVILSLVHALAASADNLVWRIKSSYRHRIQIAFYSQGRSVEWPGNGQAWDINDYDTHTYSLTCITGETICFGAWVTGEPAVYWGLGAHREHTCDRCCYVCGAGETARQILD